jgi:hypothetical protein
MCIFDVYVLVFFFQNFFEYVLVSAARLSMFNGVGEKEFLGWLLFPDRFSRSSFVWVVVGVGAEFLFGYIFG